MEENKLSMLSDKLIEIINNREDPFKKIKVIVPSYSLESYFKTYWLKDDNNVLMNVYFYTIEDFLDVSLDSKDKLFTKDIISLYILNELSSNKDEYIKLNRYYSFNNQINYNKLYDLSKMLTDLYIEYEDDLFNYKSSSSYKEDEEKLFRKIENESKNNNLITRKELINKLKPSNDIYVSFGFIRYTSLEDELINKLNISNDYNLMLKSNNEITELKIIEAPSKIREIEGIHTEMCKILLNKDITYSDILVFSPKISEYRTIIREIFHQDNKEFPSLTRSVNNEADVETDITKVLNKLKEIVKKEYYSSLDFIDLLSIPLIKKNRHLSDDDINVIKETLVSLNIKRENTNSNTINDFTYLKTRLLINQIVDINILDHNILEINDKKYYPFTSFDLTSEIISQLVDTIDDLNNLIKFYKGHNNLKKIDIDSFKEELSIWFSNLDSEGGETNSDYGELLNKLDNYKNIINDDLSLDVLFDYLMDVSLSRSGKNDQYFLNGITFANFDSTALLESKYIFLIGCDNKSFNTNLTISELDIRNHDKLKERYRKELEESFVTQVSLGENKVFISYVDQDLKTEEEIYPSDLINYIIKEKENLNTLKEYIDKYKTQVDKYEKIPLDETRSNDLLFTRREKFNKQYFDELRGISIRNSDDQETKEETNHGNDALSNQKIIEVKLTELRDFLFEPYSFWINKLFGKEDETNSTLNEEFESFDIDGLTSYSIVKDLTLNKFKKGDSNRIKEKYTLENKIPLINETIRDSEFDKVAKKASKLFDDKQGYNIKLFDDILVDKYLIKISNEILIKEEDSMINLSLIKSSSDKFKDFLELYLYSLIYAYNKENDGIEYTIHLDTNYEKDKKVPFNDYSISYDIARNRLINIINKMFESINDLKFFNWDKISKDENTSEYKYSDFNLFWNNGVYQYFDFKDLLDKWNVPGFSDESDAKETIKEYKQFFDENVCGDKEEE